MSPQAMKSIREYFRKLDSGAFGTGRDSQEIVDLVEGR